MRNRYENTSKVLPLPERIVILAHLWNYESVKNLVENEKAHTVFSIEKENVFLYYF